jgi:hypothetical protein
VTGRGTISNALWEETKEEEDREAQAQEAHAGRSSQEEALAGQERYEPGFSA